MSNRNKNKRVARHMTAEEKKSGYRRKTSGKHTVVFKRVKYALKVICERW